MIDFKCLDSSAWLDYFSNAHPHIVELVNKGGQIITSSLTLFEVKKKLIAMKVDFEDILSFIKKRSVLVVPGTVIAEKAAELSIQKKLAAMDSLIYATSLLSNAELITGDNDFRGLEKVRIIS